jgi:4-diphosphocytidyl-2-C-methyl-D-erythritol kinase
VTPAPAKINLALVVGPLRKDGKHEVLSVLAPIQLADQIDLSIADELEVAGFAEDTLVRDALEALASAAGVDPRWRVTIEKRIPVAAGLGGGSSDAATALLLANATLAEPLSQRRLHELAAGLGADIPFFLEPGPKLARGDGTDLEPVELPRDFTVVLFLPDGVAKSSTASVYDAFDARRGADGFGDRVAALEGAMQAGDLDVTVFQNAAAQGSGSVDAAAKLAKGEKVDRAVWVPFELVTPENIANYLKKN